MYSSSNTGSFTVKLRSIEYLPINPGDTVTAEIEEAGETAYYTFTPDRDMTVVYRSASENYIYGMICDSDQYYLADASGKNIYLRYDLTAGYKYYFTARFEDSNRTGSFDLILRELEYIPLSLGDTPTVDVELGGDIAYYRYTADEDAYIAIRCDAGADLVGSITDIENGYNYSSYGWNYYITYKVTAGKTYEFYTCYQDNEQTGSFTFSFDRIAFIDLEPGDRLTATISGEGDRCYYRFVPDEDMTIVFRTISDNEINATLMDENMNWLADEYQNNCYIRYNVTAGDTYYFLTRFSQSDLTGSFTVALNPLGYESIGLGETKTVEITDPGDVAYLRFVPDEDVAVYYTVDSEYAVHASICDADLNTLTNDWGEKMYLRYVLRAGQTYYLTAKFDDSYLTGSFDIALNAIPYTDIALGEKVTGGFDLAYEIKYYRFIPEKSELLKYKLSANETVRFMILDDNMNVVSEIWSDSNENNIFFEAGKTYFLTVEPDYYDVPISYTFSLARWANYKDIYAGETATADIKDRGGMVYFRFIPTANTYINYYSTTDIDTYGYLLDDHLNVLDADDDDGDGANFRISYYVRKGQTYYLGARYYSGDQTGPYDVTLTTDQFMPNGTFIRVRDRLFEAEEYG